MEMESVYIEVGI